MPTPHRHESAPELAEPVRNAIAVARQEAVRLRHPYLNSEHLLLGLLHTADARTLHLLDVLEVDPQSLAAAQVGALRPGDERCAINDPESLPYTALAKRTVARTVSEAGAAGLIVAQQEHLLLSLVGDERTPAGKVCRDAGLSVARLRSVTRSLPPPAEGARPLIELDDTSDRPISDQIVIQIQERVATGALGPGHRLPPVRRLAEQLDIAPGTVARAYAELERLGVVITEGARGTRVAERRRSARTDGPPARELVHLLRPVVITAFHMHVSADQLRAALDEAMEDIFDDGSESL